MSENWQTTDQGRSEGFAEQNDVEGDVDAASQAEFADGEASHSTDDLVAEDDVFVLDEAPDPDSVLPVWEPTGHANVDAALEQLHELTDAELSEHAQVFAGVESSLRSTLDGLAAEDESV